MDVEGRAMVSLNVVGTDADVRGAADLTRPDIDLSLSLIHI